MNNTVKKTLEKQLRILSERSKDASGTYLTEYTVQMINLAKILAPEIESVDIEPADAAPCDCCAE